MFYKFEDIQIWQLSRALCNDVYDFCGNMRDYDFKSQIQRAAVSIMNNIAEGFDRGKLSKDNKMFINFLNISYGSCGEVKSMLYLAEDLGFLTAEQSQKLRQQCTDLSIKITALIEYLQNTTKPTQTTQS